MTINNNLSPEDRLVDYGGKLDNFYKIFKSQLLSFQHPLTGLFPLYPNDQNCKISHVRESVYCATAIWAIHRGFARIDDPHGRQFELAQCAAKCMRTILIGWMRESARVEMFKQKQTSQYCLHPRFNYETGLPIADESYKNLQMDCVALFVIQLAQMIASGLQIIFTKDEVAFVQNLVFYLERAYRIPDFGMWERGTKQNRSITELNARQMKQEVKHLLNPLQLSSSSLTPSPSSIGMAKAALELISGLNLFGPDGGHSSVVLIDIDAHSRNRIIMTNLLPRESASKGSDASLIPTLCWPAYATRSFELRRSAVERCIQRLKGRYGFHRFSRDGYATVLDQNTDYQPGELMKFHGIENEWPMFFAYMVIEYCIQGDMEKANEYDRMLQPLIVHPIADAYPWLPKFFLVQREDLETERTKRGSVARKSSFRMSGESRFLWGQSVYLISQLLLSGCVVPEDLDPLGRCPHLFASAKHSRSTFSSASLSAFTPTIQIVLISESERVQQILATYGVKTQTPLEAQPIQIWPPEQLVRAGTFMGCSQRLGLSGRPGRPIGQLGTSRFYRISGLTVLCYPLLFEAQDFYLLHDMQVVIDEVKTDFQFLSKWWRLSGRPTYCLLIKEDMIMGSGFGALLRFLISLKVGTVHGTRVVLGRAQKFFTSGCVEHLDYLPPSIAPDVFFTRLRDVQSDEVYRGIDDLPSEALASLFESQQQSKESSSGTGNGGGDSTGLPAPEVVRVMQALDRSRFASNDDSELIAVMTQSEQSPYHLASSVAAAHELLNRHNLDHVVVEKTNTTIRDCLTEISRRAGIQQTWCVVRFCAALLSQFANSLAPSLSKILVGGKQLTISVAKGHTEIVVNKPLGPAELHLLLRQHVYPHDPIQFSMQQELILWVSSLFTYDKDLFNGITFIRLGWFLEAMKLQLEREASDRPESQSEDQPDAKSPASVDAGKRRSVGACQLYNLPPFMAKQLLLRTLRSSQVWSGLLSDAKPQQSGQERVESIAHSRTPVIGGRLSHLRRHRRRMPASSSDDSTSSPLVNTLSQRQLDGCLGRVPTKFYQAVYLILQRSPEGVLICDKLLSQKPTLNDMTPQDLNFIDEIEYLLRPITDPAFRSLFVEAVMVISIILERNVELSFKETVDIRAFIQAAMDAFADDICIDSEKCKAMYTSRGVRRMSWSEPDPILGRAPGVYSKFTSLPANIPSGTTTYLAKAAMDSLLHGKINLTNIDKDACSLM